jgi:hypothetical protein
MPGVCRRRKIPDFLGPDHHPARPNNDVFPSASPSWLSSTPATTPFNGDRGARPPTFKGDSRKTSKKTQAPHTAVGPSRHARGYAGAGTKGFSDRNCPHRFAYAHGGSCTGTQQVIPIPW